MAVNSCYYNLLKKKALKSICHYRVAALGVGHDGRVVGCKTNRPRFNRKGGGIHAEMALMSRYGKSIRRIYILRIGDSGRTRPISPCNACRRKAEELGIKIFTVERME